MRIGLVLGAGGIRGWGFHLGVVAALHDETGWGGDTATVVVGTSAGAGVGSLLRAGLGPTELLRRLREPTPVEVLRHERLRPDEAAPGNGARAARRRLRPQAPGLVRRIQRPLVAASGLLPEGRAPTTSMGAWSRFLHGTAWPAEPLWITAVRLSDGHRVVFGRDPGVAWPDVATAVQASCAVPAVFTPVEHHGARYVDGGVHSPTNADLLADPALGLDLVIVSSPMSASAAVPRLARRRLFHRMLDAEAAAVAATGTPVIRLEPDAPVMAVMDASQRDRAGMVAVMEAARSSVAAHLASPRVADRLEVVRAGAARAAAGVGQAVTAPSTTNSWPEQ
jgi:NTE family protein